MDSNAQAYRKFKTKSRPTKTSKELHTEILLLIRYQLHLRVVHDDYHNNEYSCSIDSI